MKRFSARVKENPNARYPIMLFNPQVSFEDMSIEEAKQLVKDLEQAIRIAEERLKTTEKKP